MCATLCVTAGLLEIEEGAAPPFASGLLHSHEMGLAWSFLFSHEMGFAWSFLLSPAQLSGALGKSNRNEEQGLIGKLLHNSVKVVGVCKSK